MKSLKYLILAVIILVANGSAFAQGGNIEYPSQKCKFFKNKIVDPSEWSVINGEATPKTASAKMFQMAEKCQDWYIGAELGLAARETNFNPTFRGFAVIGHDFCLGQHKSFGFGVEGKVGVERFHAQNYKGLTSIAATNMPMVGGNLLLHFSQHSKARVSLVLGGSYARLKSDYATPEDGTYLKNISHNTANLEGAVQVLVPVCFGLQIGGKVGYSFTHTKHLQQGQMFIGVVIKAKRVYKSKVTSYGEFMGVNSKVNKLRKAMDTNTH